MQWRIWGEKQRFLLITLAEWLAQTKSDLQEGDLKYKMDFKNVYATVLNKWLNADNEKILGKRYDYLNFI